MNPEKVTSLVDQYTTGTPVKVLAKQFGIPRHTVLRHAQRAGVAHQPKPFSATNVAGMVTMYQSGLGLERIGTQGGSNLGRSSVIHQCFPLQQGGSEALMIHATKTRHYLD